jgi:threonine dehydrogenase-like Zn-dependent dehydrogenase
VIDAVGMEAHGSPFGAIAQRMAGLLPDRLAAPATEAFGVDRLGALLASIDTVRRGGTISIIGVYGGSADPMPMMDLFDKGVALKMGQAHVKRWIPDILPLLTGPDDPLGVEDLTTHRMPLDQAPEGYDIFQRKADGCIKVVLEP